MRVQLTDAGAALLNANTGPIQLSSFKLGSAFGYIPAGTDTNIHGSLVYTGGVSPYFVVNANVVKYSAFLDYNLGPFAFGEIGIFTSDGTLFALATGDELIQKIPLSAGSTGNSIRLDIYLSMVGQNYDMWLDQAESSNEFRMAVLGSPDYLPPPQNATPNAYIITGKTGQSSFFAYTDRQGLWNFDVYAYANQASATIVAFDSSSVTINLSDFVQGMNPAYLGATILEFSTGALYGICRYVSACVISGSTVRLSFDNPLMATPIVGDKFIVFGRQSLSTTIPNLPIATHSTLGAVIIGTSLTVDSTGLINVAPTAFPVTSVNGMTGDVELTANDITGLATVAKTGQYNDLLGKPVPYSLPIASTTTLGGVKAPSDSNLTVAGDGTIDLGFSPVKTVNGNAPDGSGNVTIVPNTIGLINPANIASGADFNTLQTTGMYFALDADAGSFTNAPNNTTGGTLDIEPFTTTASGGDVIQRYTQSTVIWLRRYTQSSNTWSTWVALQAQGALPVATTSTTGVVQVGNGLNVTVSGVLSTKIQSVNGKSDQFTVLTATDVNAVSTAALGAQGGVATLDINTGTAVPATDPYTYGRIPFWQNTLGTWENAGQWDASANHLIQAHTGNSVTDPLTSLGANGTQTIDISYNDAGLPTVPTTPDYQTVSGEGNVYIVSVAGTTSLDGIASWAVGDLVVAVNGKWIKIPKTAYTLPVATSSVLGGVKDGNGVTIAGDGTLSVDGVTSNSFASTGYRTNADGTIEMFGVASFPIGTNQIDVTLPVTVPNGILSWAVTDGGNTCIPYGAQLLNSTTLRLWAPAYLIDQGTGNVIARPLIASGSWSIVVH